MTELTSLYVPADEAGIVALKREWLGARVAVVVGLVVALGVFGWFSYLPQSGSANDLGGVMADTGDGDQPVNIQTTKEGFQLCRLTIAMAENFGVVPTTMKFAGGPNKTDTQGRYACLATDTGGQQYTFASDLVCRDLNNPNCVSLVDVKNAGGTSLYHRADPPPVAEAAPAPDTATPPAGTTGSADTSSVDATGDSTPPADGSQPPPQ
jgi:hypothetical protein